MLEFKAKNMYDNIETSEILKNAASVWKYLRKQGGLSTKTYDADLVEELKFKLTLSSQGNLEDLLENINTEDFVRAFFQTVQPYAEMMSDLLRMFETAGAKQTNKNLAISFNFNQNHPELKFDLSHFRSWLETWERVLGIYLANQWNYDTIWKLNSALHESNDEDVNNSDLKGWLNQYMKEGTWPDFQLHALISGESDLDKILTRVWQVWNEVVAESSKYGRERRILREMAFKPQESSSNTDSGSLQKNQLGWVPEFLGRIDSDHWAASLAKGAYLKAERISKLPSEARLEEAAKLRNKLEDIFKAVSKVEVQRDTLVQHLQEFLQLPLWKHRYELYSIWIVTQILDALKSHSIRIHQVNGTLKFSFSGTHFATVDNFEPRLHIWTELRSPLENPIGEGRKQSIQPDYSLVIDPVTSPESSVFVVECKQYLRASSKNFSAALSDYARGRPNAHIVLVNYSSVNQNILNRVDATVRDRTSLIGMMRPGSISAQEFKTLVQQSLTKTYVHRSTRHTFSSFAEIESITLNWGNILRDLDLHLRIDTSSDTYNVCYSNKGNKTTKPWAYLNEDIQSGDGTETIKMAQWVKGKYHFAVRNYSGETPLSSCGATITITSSKQRLKLQCPDDGEGKWWSVLILDSNTNQFEVINKIVESPW